MTRRLNHMLAAFGAVLTTCAAHAVPSTYPTVTDQRLANLADSSPMRNNEASQLPAGLP